MGEKVRIAAVLVLYQDRLEDADTYISFVKPACIPALIYDNSPLSQNIVDSPNLSYHHDASNGGVSKAYNHAMAWAQSHGYTHLILLDSDSVFPPDALAVYREHSRQFPEEIILPGLHSAGHRISPFYFKQGKSHYGEGIRHGAIQLGEILAINAAALLPLESLNGQRYAEVLPLDWSDVHFFRSLAAARVKARYIPLEVQHGLSDHTQAPIASAQYRFSLYMNGIATVAESAIELRQMRFWAKLKALKLSLRYRSLWFLKQSLKQSNA